jgi:hypothetical protein
MFHRPILLTVYLTYSNNNDGNNQYNRFQLKIYFNNVIGLLKKSTSLNRRLAAKTHLVDEEFLLVAKSKEWLLKLHKCTLLPVVSKIDGNILDRRKKKECI